MPSPLAETRSRSLSSIECPISSTQFQLCAETQSWSEELRLRETQRKCGWAHILGPSSLAPSSPSIPLAVVESACARPPEFLFTRRAAGAWRSREARYDPVSQRLRDPDAETEHCREEAETRRRVVDEAFSRQLRSESLYDIVNHCPRVPEEWVREQERASSARTGGDAGSKRDRVIRPKAASVTYDIISNRPLAEHMAVDPALRPPVEAVAGKPPRKFEKFAERVDYNIITNEYKENHLQRAEHEYELSVQESMDRYWKTHVYDPLLGRYCNPRMDTEVAVATKESIRRFAEHHERALPDYAKKREGEAYNIVSGEIKDETKWNSLCSHNDRSLFRKRATLKSYDEAVREKEIEALRKVQRSYNRISEDRDKEGRFSLGEDHPPHSPRVSHIDPAPSLARDTAALSELRQVECDKRFPPVPTAAGPGSRVVAEPIRHGRRRHVHTLIEDCEELQHHPVDRKHATIVLPPDVLESSMRDESREHGDEDIIGDEVELPYRVVTKVVDIHGGKPIGGPLFSHLPQSSHPRDRIPSHIAKVAPIRDAIRDPLVHSHQKAMERGTLYLPTDATVFGETLERYEDEMSSLDSVSRGSTVDSANFGVRHSLVGRGLTSPSLSNRQSPFERVRAEDSSCASPLPPIPASGALEQHVKSSASNSGADSSRFEVNGLSSQRSNISCSNSSASRYLVRSRGSTTTSLDIDRDRDLFESSSVHSSMLSYGSSASSHGRRQDEGPVVGDNGDASVPSSRSTVTRSSLRSTSTRSDFNPLIQPLPFETAPGKANVLSSGLPRRF